MRLMYRLNGEWVQLFIDSALDRYANLSDLEDIEKAKSNLELAKDYWNKQELADGTHESIIHNICIMQDPNARFVTDEEKDKWNKKVDRPIISATQPTNMTDGQMWYDSQDKTIKINIGGAIRNVSSTSMIANNGTFPGQSREVTIEHKCFKLDGTKVRPDFVAIIPTGNTGGTLGEYWVYQDDTNIYVGNTGSYTGGFQWIAYYKNS